MELKQHHYCSCCEIKAPKSADTIRLQIIFSFNRRNGVFKLCALLCAYIYLNMNVCICVFVLGFRCATEDPPDLPASFLHLCSRADCEPNNSYENYKDL